jgi:hypothetical protein
MSKNSASGFDLVQMYLDGYGRIHLALTPGLHAEAILRKMAARHVLCNLIFYDI